MHQFPWAIAAALFFLPACTPPPMVEAAPEVAPVEEPVAPVGDFSEATPRGTAVIFARATYGGYADNALEDVLSYFDQGDQAAVDGMIGRANPYAIAVAEGEEWMFEGCYYGKYSCDLVWLRQQGSTDKWVFRMEGLTIDRR